MAHQQPHTASAEQKTRLPISRSVIDSPESPTTVVGQRPYGKSRLNPVMNYAGDSSTASSPPSRPILIFAEPTGRWPTGLKKTRYNHYDNPSRHDRRLYAIDAEGRLVTNADGDSQGQ